MIDDILEYVDTYDNIRAVCGLNEEELKDAELGLMVYRNQLGLALNKTSGVYAPETESQTLVEIYDRLSDSDEMYVTIQMYAVYVVAETVLGAVGLKAYKTQADGKAALTRFSSESTYLETRKAVREGMSRYLGNISAILGTTAEAYGPITAVKPLTDPVTGG